MPGKVAGAGPCAGSPGSHAFAFNLAVMIDSFRMDWRSRKRRDHSPPDWLREEPDYFLTVCAQPRSVNHFCNASVGPAILESVQHRNEKQIWFCHIVVLMPDHIHLMVSFPDLPFFSGVIGNWKHWLSRKHSISWQENFFEHRIRKDESFGEKVEYILQNPVRAGLVDKAENWAYIWIAEGC
jgi:putative transposase